VICGGRPAAGDEVDFEVYFGPQGPRGRQIAIKKILPAQLPMRQSKQPQTKSARQTTPPVPPSAWNSSSGSMTAFFPSEAAAAPQQHRQRKGEPPALPIPLASNVLSIPACADAACQASPACW